ncbi:MAG TPA: hypothetical protein VFJ43_06670, partial [Bacteroidia bacterium]|nr:hypothetical protein [Bacteroidia bacterium]
MRKELKFIFILFLLGIFSVNAHAAKRYWVGATSNSWKLKANWSSSSGGAGGSTIPGSSDTAFFDGSATSHHRCDIDSTVNIKRLSMTGDTLSQGANTITIGSVGATLSGGVFLGGSSDITVSGTFTISGNTFTSTSGTFSTSANLTISSGSFTHNSGTLSLTASSTLAISRTGGVTFYNLSFAPTTTSTYTITSTTAINVSHLLSYDGSSAITVNTGNINAKGDISITNTSTSGNGTATITINGSGTQTITGTSTVAQGKLPNIVINKSSSDTLKLVNTISVIGNWTYTAGKISAGTSTLYFANVLTITGNHSLYNVIFVGTTFTIASGTTLTVNGTLTTRGTGACVINTGTINAKGDIKISNTSSAGGGTASLNINGTGNQAFTGNSAVGYGPLCKVTVNKSSGTLTLDSIISLAGGWTYTAGTISAGTSTVAFYDNSQTITGSDTLNNVTFYSSTANYTYTVA